MNLTGTLAAVLLRCLSNFRTMWLLQHPLSWLWDFTRSFQLLLQKYSTSLEHLLFWMDVFCKWLKWSPVWGGVSHVTFDHMGITCIQNVDLVDSLFIYFFLFRCFWSMPWRTPYVHWASLYRATYLNPKLMNLSSLYQFLHPKLHNQKLCIVIYHKCYWLSVFMQMVLPIHVMRINIFCPQLHVCFILNLLTSGRCSSNFENTIFKPCTQYNILGSDCEITLW